MGFNHASLPLPPPPPSSSLGDSLLPLFTCWHCVNYSESDVLNTRMPSSSPSFFIPYYAQAELQVSLNMEYDWSKITEGKEDLVQLDGSV